MPYKSFVTCPGFFGRYISSARQFIQGEGAYVATIVSVDNFSGSVGEGRIYDVVLDHGGKMPFLEAMV
jgi:hypothetical protein